MQIANPIYDVVFKYLMEDNQIAKLVISSIIGETIETLDFLSQERTTVAQSQTVYRLDFAATIQTPEGQYKRILIDYSLCSVCLTKVRKFREVTVWKCLRIISLKNTNRSSDVFNGRLLSQRFRKTWILKMKFLCCWKTKTALSSSNGI